MWSEIRFLFSSEAEVSFLCESSESDAKTTAELRKQNFTIIVAPGYNGKSKVWLYLDDGESADVGDRKTEIEFTWDGKRFEMAGTFGYDEGDVVIASVAVLSEHSTYKARTIIDSWKLDKALACQV